MLLGSTENEMPIKLKGQMLYNDITRIPTNFNTTFIMKYSLSFAFWHTDKNQQQQEKASYQIIPFPEDRN